MKEISVGVIFTPLTAKDWDLKGITGKGEFEEVHPPDNYYTWLSSADRRTEVGVYFDGMVYYTKKVSEEELTPAQMLDIVKAGFDFIQNSRLDKNYLRRVGLVIRGEGMKMFYDEKQQVIEEFGRKLFENPLSGKIEITDSDIHTSFRELLPMSFASTFI